MCIRDRIKRAERVLDELQLQQIVILGIAKGPDRKAGLEKYVHGGCDLDLGDYASASQLLQHIRDEAHRFAIAGTAINGSALGLCLNLSR